MIDEEMMEEAEEKTSEQLMQELIEWMDKKTLEELNNTELSQAAKKVTSQDYLEKHDLILAAAMDEYLT